MVTIKYNGRLGNNLFQYAMGRMIATDKGYRLLANPVAGFPGTMERVDGLEIAEDRLVLEGHAVDWEAVRATDKGIRLRGYFQNWKFYAPRGQEIRQWFRLENVPEVPSGDLAVQVRLGDYVGKGALAPEWYRLAIESQCFDQLNVVTDEPNHEFIGELRRQYGARVVCTKPIDDFKFLLAHRRMIISDSTFAWWAGWLSDADLVIRSAPNLDPIFGGFHSTRPDIDLYVDDPKWQNFPKEEACA